ncbi:ABC transporter substrate-binding protein [Allostreptomyces psammosilenae]|uniref:Peptide/nickel transport system substrate-binding protein n=1 Tax=Allostreptomyces psammosilenae TaxID=1892865 RepID=A0A852ZY90_9ACTN|nr:ABC transporter substrate-binding protein [Allostreptomyces psammosilenae]NYI06767.1 peptide/nickel transport system substrate-binding protein [Allostreptomyces psammosilenae]
MFHRRGPRRHGRAAAIGTVALALAAAGCTGSANNGGGGAGGTDADTLIVYTGQAGDWQINFNPYSPTMLEGPGTIFEPLFYYNNLSDSEPTPRLGTDFSWNEDGTELTISLRSDATWTDGEPFTAADVEFTLDMVAENPTLNSTGYAGDAEAVDDTTVRITFEEPAYMEEAQILGKLFIVPEHIWADLEDPATNVMENPVGTGPFTLGQFTPQAFTLTANPDYYDGEPALKNVRYVALSGNQSGADALSAGTIDWQTGPVPDIANVSENYPGYEAITVPMNQTTLMTCSNAEMGCTGPQTDQAVRQAIYYAIDRTQLNALAFENTSSEISPGFALLERDAEYISDQLPEPTAPMSPDTARSDELLQGAGWTKGGDGIYAKDGERLSLTVKVVAGWTDYITAVDTMAQQLKAAGIELVAQQVSWNEWSDARGRGEYQLLIDSLYQGPAADPYFLYSYFFSSDTTAPVGEVAQPNFARYSDPAVDEALAALKSINPEDTAARQAQFDVIQTRIAEAMPYIPVLTGGTTSEYHAEKFTGWPTLDNLYAIPAVWSRPDQSQIFLNLKPAS